MLTTSKANKAPKLYLTTGKSALALRKKLKFNQRDFWPSCRRYPGVPMRRNGWMEN